MTECRTSGSRHVQTSLPPPHPAGWVAPVQQQGMVCSGAPSPLAHIYPLDPSQVPPGVELCNMVFQHPRQLFLIASLFWHWLQSISWFH